MRRIAVLLWAVLGLCGVALAQEGAAASGDVAAPLERALQRATLGQFWGAVLVVRDGEVLLAKGYGYANEDLEPITADHLFDIASASKMFTAAAILKLESRGVLSTEDTIAKFFPEAGEAASKITLYHLMTHTSGKSDERGAIKPLNFADREGAVRGFVESPPKAAPGEKFEYCNGGYVVLGAVIEQATGKPFEEAMRALVLEPAGMTASGYLDGAGLDTSKQTVRMTQTYGARGRRGLLLDKRVEPWAWGLRGAGGLVTSVNELIKWDRAIREHKVLDAKATAKWFNVNQSNYACGWQVHTMPNGRVKQMHGGATRGYMCELSRYPEEKVFIAVLTNESGRYISPMWIADELTKVLWPPPEPARAVLDFGADLPKGIFSVTVEEGPALDVAAEEGRVVLTMSDPSKGRTLARCTMPRQTAKELAGMIRDGLANEAHQPTPSGGVKAGIYGYLYSVTSKEPRIEVREARWMVQPFYNGISEDGKPVTDPRLLIIMLDADMPGGWPLMIQADDPAAEALAGNLEKAVGEE